MNRGVPPTSNIGSKRTPIGIDAEACPISLVLSQPPADEDGRLPEKVNEQRSVWKLKHPSNLPDTAYINTYYAFSLVNVFLYFVRGLS